MLQGEQIVRGSRLPPGPKLPAPLLGLRYLRDPLGFHMRLYRRYGELFTASMPLAGRVIYVASPQLVKAIFTRSPSEIHTGTANLQVLEPAFGTNSLLT